VNLDFPHERAYVAIVDRIVDGDTIECYIDMGLRITIKYKVRLLGCNAWELKTEAGKAAREHLVQRLPLDSLVILTMVKDYKYGGEFVARVTLEDGTNLVAELIEQQWAAAWDGNGPAPTPTWPRSVA